MYETLAERRRSITLPHAGSAREIGRSRLNAEKPPEAGCGCSQHGADVHPNYTGLKYPSSASAMDAYYLSSKPARPARANRQIMVNFL